MKPLFGTQRWPERSGLHECTNSRVSEREGMMPLNRGLTFKKLGIGALLVIALLIGDAFTSTNAAHAAPSHALAPSHVLVASAGACKPNPSHANCDGVDPYAANCVSGSYAVRSKSLYYGTAYVIWSPNCQTNWARTVMQDNSCVPLLGDCWQSIVASLYVLHFDSNGYYQGSETYLNLGNSTYGYDSCNNGCNHATVWYGNMYYAPNEEVMADGQAYDWSWNESRGCAYTGASWRYSSPGHVPYCP